MPMRGNPLPMGTAAAAGSSTPAMQLQMAKAYGSMGGTRSASRRRAKPKKNGARKKRASGGRKLKFGSKAWRAKYMKRRKK